MVSLEKKKKIGYLTILLFFTCLALTFIDAIMAVNYPILPETPSDDFYDLVVNGPIWWKINPMIIFMVIAVGIASFVIGNETERDIKHPRELKAFTPLILTFVFISISGLGDLMSQTIIEVLCHRQPFSWINYGWWWTKFVSFPFIISSLFMHDVPTGLDMIISSAIGIVLLVLVWLIYFNKFKLKYFNSETGG